MPWFSYALISAFCIAVVGLLEKKTLQKEHSAEYVTVFSIMKLGLFLLFFWSAINWSVTGSQLTWLIIDGSIGALAFFMVAKAMKRMEISSAVPILSLDPGLTAILALIFLGERLTSVHILGLSLMVLGTYVLELHRNFDSHGVVIGNRWKVLLSPLTTLWKKPGGNFILAGLFLFSLSATLDRFVLVRVPTNTYIGYTLIVSSIIFLIVFLRDRRRPNLLAAGKGSALFIIGIAAALHLISNISQAHAVAISAVSLVIAIKRLSVLIDVILGGKFFHEKHLPQKILATVIMLIGVFCIVRP